MNTQKGQLREFARYILSASGMDVEPFITPFVKEREKEGYMARINPDSKSVYAGCVVPCIGLYITDKEGNRQYRFDITDTQPYLNDAAPNSRIVTTTVKWENEIEWL